MARVWSTQTFNHAIFSFLLFWITHLKLYCLISCTIYYQPIWKSWMRNTDVCISVANVLTTESLSLSTQVDLFLRITLSVWATHNSLAFWQTQRKNLHFIKQSWVEPQGFDGWERSETESCDGWGSVCLTLHWAGTTISATTDSVSSAHIKHSTEFQKGVFLLQPP